MWSKPNPHATPAVCVRVIHTHKPEQKQETARHAELVNVCLSGERRILWSQRGYRSKVRNWEAAYLAHHQGAFLGAVSIRVVVGVVLTSHHAEGLVGTLTRWPETETSIYFISFISFIVYLFIYIFLLNILLNMRLHDRQCSLFSKPCPINSFY